MKTFVDYVDELKEKEKLSSDNELAKLLTGKEERSSLVSKWRAGTRPDDYYCIVIAQKLGINPLEIIAAANMEREQDPSRLDWWEDFSKRHGFKALSVALMVGSSGFLINYLGFLETVPKLYIMSSYRHRYRSSRMLLPHHKPRPAKCGLLHFGESEMRHFPKLDDNSCPDDLLVVMTAPDDVRELAGIGVNKWREMKTGARPVSMREYRLLRFLCGLEAPPSWGDWSGLRITEKRLYLAGMRWQDGITKAELLCNGLTRTELNLVSGQADLIERLTVERDFYKKHCGFTARHGLMLWRCFGD